MVKLSNISLSSAAEAMRQSLSSDAQSSDTYVPPSPTTSFNSQIIYQAGVDYESKPIIVFCAANLPNPNSTDYDALLEFILSQLDLYVESDYTCILFVGGATNKPPWQWLVKAYRSLTRKYKKNLKNLYIVHPVLWVKVLMEMMHKIISPKFSKKVTWIKTLSELARFVPLHLIVIPSSVQNHNLKFENSIAYDGLEPVSLGNGKVFGAHLSDLMGNAGEEGIPEVVTICMEYVLANGLQEEGIFRRSPPSITLKEAKNSWNRGQFVDLDKYGIHVAAVLIKVFLRELASPLLPSSTYPAIQSLPLDNDEKVTYIIEILLPQLSTPQYSLLSYLSLQLNKVVKASGHNKMSANNLAVVFAPNLINSGDPRLDALMCTPNGKTVGNLLLMCFEYPDRIFKS